LPAPINHRVMFLAGFDQQPTKSHETEMSCSVERTSRR
jgi:hypothetical protein